MLLNTLQQLNWVDIFVIIVLFRISYVAIKNGLVAEFFKLSGTILAVYLGLHYYINCSDYLAGRIGLKNVPLELLDAFCFAALAILGYLVFALLRALFSRFLKMEAVPNLSKWGGFVLGIFRGFLFVSLLIFIFVLSPVSYLKHSVKNSFSGKDLFKIAPGVYTHLWNGIMSKFMTAEKFNANILVVEKTLESKKGEGKQ